MLRFASRRGARGDRRFRTAGRSTRGRGNRPLALQEDGDGIFINDLPFRPMLEHVADGVIGREQDGANLVFIQKRVRILQPRDAQVVLENSGVLEDVGAAVNKYFGLGTRPRQIAAPTIEVEDVRGKSVRLDVSQRRQGKMVPQLPSQLLFRGDVPDKEAKDDKKEEGVQYRFVVLRPITRQEVQKARQHRRNQQRRQEQEPDIGQPAIEAEDHERQIGQLPIPPVEQRPAQQHRDEKEDNLTAAQVKVYRGPLLNVGDVQLLAIGQIERIINQLPAVGVDEQRPNRRQADLDQVPQLLRRPFPRFDAAPLASHQPCRSHNPENYHPQKPRPVRIDPKQKK